ncbi:hypothetical protein ACFX1Z_022285 [Malus domestica]
MELQRYVKVVSADGECIWEDGPVQASVAVPAPISALIVDWVIPGMTHMYFFLEKATGKMLLMTVLVSMGSLMAGRIGGRRGSWPGGRGRCSDRYVEANLLRVCAPCATGGVWWSEAAESGTKTGGFRDVLEGMTNGNSSVDAIAKQLSWTASKPCMAVRLRRKEERSLDGSGPTVETA